MDELEVMRQQLAMMKSQLETQEIINKDLLRKVMQNRASWLNVLVTTEIIAFPIIFLLIAGICYIAGISQWFSFIFLILGGIDVVLDRRTIRIPKEMFSTSSIINLKKFLVRQKKERFFQTFIGGGLCIVWLILFICAVYASNSSEYSDNDLRAAVINGGLVGAIIGVIISIIVIYILYQKMQSTNDQIIADLEEIEK